MPKFEWVGAARADSDNTQFDPSRLLNCYRERHGGGFVIKSVMGMTSHTTLTGVFMREMQQVGGNLYAAHGGKLYRVSAMGTTVTEGTILDAADTTISGNNGAITVAAGGEYYSIEGEVTSTPATGAFNNIGSVSFIGQRTVLTEKDGPRIQWSDPADSTTFDALNFATAESRDDNLIRGMVINGQFWAFGERSIERWYLSGSSNTSEFLLPVSGSTMDIGLKAFGLITEVTDGAFMVGSDNLPRLISGGAASIAANPSVVTAISQGQPDRCFFYEDEGQKICVIKFLDRPAWCYDLATQEWHERAEGELFSPWSAVSAARAYGESFVGTQLGGIYKMTRTNEDATGPLLRRIVTRTIENDGNSFTLDLVQLKARMGMSDLGRDAQVMIRTSRDEGETWSRERWRSLGRLGQYRTKAKLHSLGWFKDTANLEFTISDPAEIPVDAVGYLELT